MNIVHRIKKQAQLRPEAPALKVCDEDRPVVLNFSELDKRIEQIASALTDIGVRNRDKVLMFVKPGENFSALVFALYKIGAIPVFIDPGMKKKNLFSSILSVAPRVLIAVNQVHFLRPFFRKVFASVEINISMGNRSVWGTVPLSRRLRSETKPVDTVELAEDELSTILFTSGGTGIPKGVEYSHKILETQTDALGEMFKLGPEDVDLAGFPLFALFTQALGMCSCIPELDVAKPSKANPEKLYKNIIENQATFVAGSPAIWINLMRYCVDNNLQLPSVKNLVMFGAPVALSVHEGLKKVLPNGKTFTPYGATECLPVSNIDGESILKFHAGEMAAGKGTCVGQLAPTVQVKIIEVSDAPENQLKEVGPGSIGEICVTGPMVTKAYFEMPEQTQLAKIVIIGQTWHRMGDLGHLDKEGRLWFCGRKSHRVQRNSDFLCTVPLENIVNQHPEVEKCAFVGPALDGRYKTGFVIQRKDRKTLLRPEFTRSFESELKGLLENSGKRELGQFFVMKKDFPVDIRHNIKIDRLALKVWVEKNKERVHLL